MAKKIPIGLQVYSVRMEAEKDLPGVLKAIAKMGYDGVDFAGYYGYEAKEVRKILDDVGLKCCGGHLGLNTLMGDELKRTIEYQRTLGNKYLIVPGLPEERRKSRAAWQETAKIFNDIADKLKPEGMMTGYHNHAIEFQPLDGELPWDTFFGNTKKEVIMQMDTGNAMHGGADPMVFLKKYPGRAVTVHLKAFSKTNNKALIGEDEVPWNDVFNVCETIGGTEWYIVEQESYAYPPMECVERCIKTLREWGK